MLQEDVTASFYFIYITSTIGFSTIFFLSKHFAPRIWPTLFEHYRIDHAKINGQPGQDAKALLFHSTVTLQHHWELYSRSHDIRLWTSTCERLPIWDGESFNKAQRSMDGVCYGHYTWTLYD